MMNTQAQWMKALKYYSVSFGVLVIFIFNHLNNWGLWDILIPRNGFLEELSYKWLFWGFISATIISKIRWRIQLNEIDLLKIIVLSIIAIGIYFFNEAKNWGLEEVFLPRKGFLEEISYKWYFWGFVSGTILGKK